MNLRYRETTAEIGLPEIYTWLMSSEHLPDSISVQNQKTMREYTLNQTYLRLTPKSTPAALNPAKKPKNGTDADISILPLNEDISDSGAGKYESGNIYGC